MGRSELSRQNLRRIAVGAASAVCLLGSLGAARAADWAPTNTKAFLPSILAPRAHASAALQRFQRTLSTASTHAVDLSDDTAVDITVALKLRNEADLDHALAEIADPANKQFGRYMTPAEFLAAYAPSRAQVSAVVAHLQKAGFTNIQVAPNRLLITASGDAAAVKSGFHTGLSHFTFDGRDVFANKAAASVPTALAGIVNSVLGLQTVSVAHTMHKATLIGDANRSSVLRARAAGSATAHAPTDFAKIYDASSIATGSKTSVGIITWGTLTQVQRDLSSFTTKYGLPAVTNSVVKTGTSRYYADTNSDVEWNLDSQSIVGSSGGVSQIIFYSAPDTASDGAGGHAATLSAITGAYNRAVTDNKVKVINVSLGVDEDSANSSGSQAADDAIFKQAQAQGQTFSVSAGDHGAYESSNGAIADGDGNPTVDLSQYSVSEPATSPYVIAVGGTTLYTSGTTTWSSETVWNEGLESTSDPNVEQLWATGGGTSAYEAAPSWQSGSNRTVPDIGFDAAQSTGATVISHGNTYQVGGTSLASPIFVGLWARLESANNNALGFPAASFYKYFPSNPSLLHDVTSGNNGYEGYGFAAAKGYDQVTGFGSFDVAKLARFISSTSGFAR